MARAQYRWAMRGGIVGIVDIGTHSMSVTNDAEAVVREVWTAGGRGRFFYRDSEGDWDELLHRDGVFQDFAPVNDKSLVAALGALKSAGGAR